MSLHSVVVQLCERELTLPTCLLESPVGLLFSLCSHNSVRRPSKESKEVLFPFWGRNLLAFTRYSPKVETGGESIFFSP